MKTFILCGGFGTRLDKEGTLIAKPMVRIGNEPILMHIIKNYTDQGFNQFVFCLGHRSNTISNYFLKENHTRDMWGNICVNGTFSFTQTLKEKLGYSTGNPLYYIW
jgi:glucose-1-phosphate cytidylyltransferase